MASGRTVALSDDLADHAAADPVGLGNLGQAHSAVAIPHDGDSIDVQGAASDLAAFKFGATHAGPDPFDDQIPFEFGNSSDDDHDGAAERPAGVDVLPETDELNVEVVQFV